MTKMQLTAKPRYLLLLHRGKEKSNTVTALVIAFCFDTCTYSFSKVMSVRFLFQLKKQNNL